LNLEAVLASVRRTGRLVTVDTGFVTYGVGAEIVSRTMEQCCLSMKAAPRRIGLPEHPTPSSRSLAAGYYPRSPDIGATIAEVAGAPRERVGAVRAQLAEDRESVPLDIPHHSFQGPF
jgi:pyruvate/2-oxoglutarate/acetoin dehydrogenase E1 component